MATDIAKFNSIKDVPKDQIHATSSDGKTVVLIDGTKVSDKLIAEAKAKPKAKEAAAAPIPLTVGAELLKNSEFVAGVRAIAEEAAQRIFDASAKK